MLNDIGRVCVKIAGRDAGKKCVIVEIIDDTSVLIDGATRRRKCNITHLEPTKQILDLKIGATHKDVEEAFKSAELEFRKETKPKTASEKPRKLHVAREKKAKK